MRLGVARALVGERWVSGDVAIGADGRIESVGLAPTAAGGLAAPGFVDLQVNGFAGVDFLATDANGYERAGRAMAATGVTGYQPTIITSSDTTYRLALALVAGLGVRPGGPRVLGVHLEGPFISPDRCGAHPPDLIREPDLGLASELVRSAPVTTMTVAPELPGSLELIGWLSRVGVVVSLGHSDASASEAHRGFDAGASTVTHLFNAMRPFGHREPGLAGAALARSDVIVQTIVDHVHLAPDATVVAWQAARGRFAVVTDAISAAGTSDGRHRLGSRSVEVTGDEVRLSDGTLAGSVLTMDRALRNLVGLGVPVEEALLAASAVPARLLGRSDIGRLEPGAPADVVVLDDGLRPVRTLVEGREVFASG